jgi:hypothetical protein
MPDGAQGLRVLKMPQPTNDDNPYVEFVKALVRRAVEDAQGHVVYPGNRAPGQLAVEARAWLAEGGGLAELLELAGFESEPVLQRVRQLFPPETERSRA